jgi:hypothetical protein
MIRTVWNIGVELARMVTGPVAALGAGAAAFGALACLGFAVYSLAWPPFEAPNPDAATLVYVAVPYAATVAGFGLAWSGRGFLFLLAWAAR